MVLKLYNTLTGVKEEVKPIRDDNTIRMYICGPTVYDDSHLGHFRTFIFYDVLVRYLIHKGYNVIHVVNVTDIDDKIINRANEEGVDYKVISERYLKSFIEDWVSLNLLPPYVMPRATYHIKDMIKIIEGLMKKGYAYQADRDIYFDISRFGGYGLISKQDINELIEGYRVEVRRGKRNPLDFALWKGWREGEPYWDSPWGRGRPGWHIECTAMSIKFLDPPFEVHGGGEDLKFPHHENERAQSNAYLGYEVAKIWTHVGLFKLGAEKMSKSLGNIIRIKDALKRYNPSIIRIYYITTHYRKQQIFSEKKLEEAENIYEKIVRVYNHIIDGLNKADEGNKMDFSKYKEKFYSYMDDDLNTSSALSTFLSFLSEVESYLRREKKYDYSTLIDALDFTNKVLDIFGLKIEVKRLDYEKLVELIINVRKELRSRKIYDLSDYIREELEKLNIMLEDYGEETRYYIL